MFGQKCRHFDAHFRFGRNTENTASTANNVCINNLKSTKHDACANGRFFAGTQCPHHINNMYPGLLVLFVIFPFFLYSNRRSAITRFFYYTCPSRRKSITFRNRSKRLSIVRCNRNYYGCRQWNHCLTKYYRLSN